MSEFRWVEENIPGGEGIGVTFQRRCEVRHTPTRGCQKARVCGGRSTTRGQPDPASHALPVGKGVGEQRLPSEVGQNPRAGEAAK